MPKRKEQQYLNGHPLRKSEFNPERESFMDRDGNYVYCRWEQQRSGGWELKVACKARIGEDGVTSDFTVKLDDIDCEEDRLHEQIRRHRDKNFEMLLTANIEHVSHAKEGKTTDPWERISYEKQSNTDILDEIFPENQETDPRIIRLCQIMKSLNDNQKDLIYEHLGMGKTFEQIAAEESERKHKAVTKQAIHNRWNKILNRCRKEFGIE